MRSADPVRGAVAGWFRDRIRSAEAPRGQSSLQMDKATLLWTMPSPKQRLGDRSKPAPFRWSSGPGPGGHLWLSPVRASDR